MQPHTKLFIVIDIIKWGILDSGALNGKKNLKIPRTRKTEKADGITNATIQ